MPSRIFRLFKLPRRHREAAGPSSPPSDLRPGELAVGENEGVLYYGKADGSTVTLTGGGGGVASTGSIVALTQAEYSALTPTANTTYLIIE
jgi:hypothetical protein